MENTGKEINFDELSLLQNIATEYFQIENSYILGRIEPQQDIIEAPEIPTVKFDGMLFMLIRGGSLTFELNDKTYEAVANTLMVLTPTYPLKIVSGDWSKLDIHILFLSRPFLQDINMNLMAISNPALIEGRSPMIRLEHHEMKVILKYFSLLRANVEEGYNMQLNKYIASSLSSALFYQIILYGSRRLRPFDPEKVSHRRNTYTQEFIRLVNANYTRERSVGFYARKLFVSPKYLSLIVKETTGRSAARWIDDFVIMEAKNLLRFSGKNIQQVAYALNFSNQSSFGKYFKHLTGMSPTEYQKS